MTAAGTGCSLAQSHGYPVQNQNPRIILNVLVYSLVIIKPVIVKCRSIHPSQEVNIPLTLMDSNAAEDYRPFWDYFTKLSLTSPTLS
jgi:hypothetical protein